jgi:2'-5' RNA ligase
MEKLAQKWAIIAPLESIEEGAEFLPSEFPLHITLAGVFAINTTGNVLSGKLLELLARQTAIQAFTDTGDFFGPNKDVYVMKLRKTPKLMSLYNKIHDKLNQLGATFNEPQYEADGYIPHSTVQRNARLSPNQIVSVNTVAIVDLFPNGDGHKRKIFKIITL